MNTENTINRFLLDALNESITHPFLVMDDGGNILSSNKEARQLFSLPIGDANLFDLIDEDSSEKISQYFHELTETKSAITRELQIIFGGGEEYNCQITLNAYRESRSLFIFCSFKRKESRISLRGISRIHAAASDIKDVIQNTEIFEIVEEIRSLYPFTFIGKEKIRKDINKLEEFFWVKDGRGNFLLINDKFSRGLGLKTTQIEGKNENNFIPQYLVNIRKSIDDYINESLNCVILQGIPLKGIPADEQYQTIEFPLTDTDNNVVAIIGIAQLASADSNKQINFFKLAEETAKFFPGLFLLTDKSGKIEAISNSFKELLNIEVIPEVKSAAEIFPGRIASAIRNFLVSDGQSTVFETNDAVQLGIKLFNGLNIKIDALFSENRKAAGYLLFVSEKNEAVELDQLITGRGRMFEALVQNNPEPIYIYDKDNLRFLEVNSAALSMYGYSRDEFLLMDLTDLYTPEDIQTLLDSSNTSIKEGKFSGPYKHRRKDGTSVFVEISKLNFKYKEQEAHFNIVKDVTERLELEKQSKVFKASFDNMSDLQFITDPNGFIQYSNQKSAEVLGYSSSELLNSSFPSLFSDEERGKINSSIFKKFIQDSLTLTSKIKKKQGEAVEVSLKAIPVLDYKNEVESFNIIVQLKEKNLIKEVVKEVIIEKTAAGMPAAGQKNSAFLSSVFHELLTPINVILGFVQELTEGVDSLNPDQKEAAEIINQNRLNLLNTMNSVMELAAIERNDTELTRAETNITDVLEALGKEIEDLSSVREVEFTYGKISSSLSFYTDKQKFVNLLSQIVRIVARLTKEKKIYFSAHPYNDNSFIVSVKDGYSVSSSDLIDTLIQLFSDEETGSRKDFGISKLVQRLAKSLLLILNGKFEVYINESGKREYGFVFLYQVGEITPADEIKSSPIIETLKTENPEVSLKQEKIQVPAPPLTNKEEEVSDDELWRRKMEEIYQAPEEVIFDSTEEEPVKAVPAAPQYLSNTAGSGRGMPQLSELSCLYIEDQVDSQILFKVQMKELKDIKFAVSFEEALPLLDSHTFDFIVMDINLQGEYNGLDALKIIKKMPDYMNTPIVAVTAYVLPGDKEKFIATGFSDFISKPIFREKMIDSLEKIFSLR